ncbi:MAG: hypothetical protein OEW08_13380, partial [Gammaproteobacteria bacterium]|nr:hypothetical protein [Gammaproteobacteria bacterium]
SRGYYEVQLKRKDALPVLLEVKSGYYEEDVSDLSTTVTLKKGEILTAVGYYQHTTPLTLHVTPYTHIATGLTEYWVSENIPVVEAIHRANAAVSRMLGDIDITTTPPLRTGVVDGPGGMKHAASMTMDVPANYLYGLFTGALSVYAKEINSLSNATASRYTSIGLAQRMYEDIKSDGVLDGKIIIEGVTQQLKYGAEKLNSTRYRQLIGQGALSLANTHSNDNDIPFEAVMHKAHYFAESRDPLFGAGTPFPFDTDPPVIGAFVRTAYDKIKGDVSYYVDAQDPVGVRGIKVSVDKVLVTDSVARSGVTLDLNLHDVLPGEHSVTVEAMDILGNIASKAFTIIMPDGKPVAEITSPLLSNKTQYLAQGDYIDDGGAGIASIVLTVNGVPTSATIDAATGRWQAPLTLADGQNSLFIRITDKQGASREITRTVSIDTQPPEMRVSASISETELYQNGQVVLGKLSNAIVNGDPLYIPRKRISFADPTVPSGDLDNAKIPYFTVINLSGEEVEVSLQYRVNGEVRTALHPLRPTFADKNIYIIPLIGEVLAEEWYQTEPSDTQFLDVQIKDKAGNAQMQSVSFHAFFDLPVIRVRSNVRDAMVHAHEFTLGAAGGEVGHCMTDAQGECSMRVLVEPGLLHFTLMSGGYNEPASGVVASLKDMQSLSSVVDYNGANIDIAITPYTHLGMGLIQHAIDSGSGSVRAAYSKALEDVAALYGYDVFATIPNNPALPVVAGSVLSKESRYALLLAGLSAWTAQLNTQNGFAPHTVHTSVSAAQVFYQDALADGKLNGIGGMMHGDTQVLTLNGEAIDANTYRMTLASQMLNYATERNLFKGGNKDALWAYAQGVAENTHTIFAGAAPVGTDATWTVIKLLSERATKL